MGETDEVPENARETVSSPKGMQAWLKRLVGRYTYTGYVDVCGKGNAKDQRSVKGRADCVATSAAPDVHCRVNASWPAERGDHGKSVLGGVSNLAPAQYLFSIESPHPERFVEGEGANFWGIVFVQVDQDDRGEWASGVLVGDTFLSTEPCADLSRDCRKITRITAKPDSNEISMTVEVRINRQRVLRQAFVLHRQVNSRAGK